MIVFMPVKFDKRGVNIAGIHYQLHSIGIEALLLKALGGVLPQIPKISKL